MSRFRVRAGRLVVILSVLLSLLFAAFPVLAQTRQSVPASAVPTFWFAGTRLIFERPDRVDDEIAVRASDPGLQRFLARVGATISWQPSSRYVVVTTAERKTLTFTLGLPRFQTGSATQNAPLNAYLDGSDVYLPFLTLARALYVQPIWQGNEYVLEPLIGSLESRDDGKKTIVTLHGATQLHFKKSVEAPDRLTLTFSGTGSSLQPSRRIDMPGLGQIDVTVVGTVRAPQTTVTFQTPPGSVHAMYPSTTPNELVLVFGRGDVALGGSQIPGEADVTVASAVTPAPETTMNAQATATPMVSPTGNAFVTAVDVDVPTPDALTVRVAVSAGVPFEWHRLGDDRFYVDVRNATLSAAPRDDRPNAAFVQGLRIRQLQLTPVAIVRVALTLTPNRRIDVVPDERGLTINVADVDAGHDFVAMVGTGQTGGTAAAVLSPAPVPATSSTSPVPPPPGSNPRLIVIDPGHGGSDTGAMQNGLVEKDLTLDIALRLRNVLVGRGWQVNLTRERDTDVYGPNASDVAELQARVDVANFAGARLFVSLHVNSSTSSTPNGTTVYYYKPEDRALAAAVQRRLIPTLGTKDDGVQKERFYVIRHTTMPAALIETAFMSNAGDAARLRSSDFRQAVAQSIADGIKDYAGAPGGPLSQQ